ncbi:uncharacterized protein HMPREF1541_09676 [Cyphellophora europaea CBS 101466]|uniref:SRP9 domain-containing protein n=1 Tax=Cyphellophora europaea (strain CBS 101466) TaxID=1220924 RepID=W2S7X0_CYPE1|nr:uncharacterized protein HMPREF1541_09676 [Cyphellophora europaea CBS 101466]ETN44801.1 hypothetical protein HMPREF1541_09676 [Cyphellophora europaea CBS 101466]
MPDLPTLNAFLSSASLLLSAYPSARITTKYSLPRAPKNASSKPTKQSSEAASTNVDGEQAPHQKKEPSATLTCKVYHAPSGICLKYKTDKAQEVGRLITSLGKLGRGEAIEVSSAAAGAEMEGEKMDVDSGPSVAVKEEDAVVTGKPVAQQAAGGSVGGGGGKKKKKGKR